MLNTLKNRLNDIFINYLKEDEIMRNLKKILSVIAITAMLILVAGCSKESEQPAPEQPAQPTVQPAPAMAPAPAPAEPAEEVVQPAPPTPAPTEEPVVTAAPAEEPELEEEVEEAQELFDRFTEDKLELGSSADMRELLYKQEVSLDEEDYTVRTYFDTNEGLKVEFSLAGDKDFESTPALTYEKRSISIYVVIKDGFDFSDVSEDNELKLEVLGHRLNIVKREDDKLTLLSGSEVWLEEGNLLDGVKLEVVGRDSAVLTCDGEVETVDEGEVGRICGKQVRVTSMISKDNYGAALVRVGDDLLETVEDGDVYVEDDEGEAVWQWTIDTDENLIGWEYVSKADREEEEVLRPGDSLDLLGLLTLSFDYDESPEYSEYEMSFDEYDLDGEGYVEVLVLEGNYEYGDEEEASKLLWDGESYYAKIDGGDWEPISEVILAGSELSLGEDLTLGEISLSVDLESQEILSVYVGEEDVSEREHDVLTQYGIVIWNVDDALEDGVLVLDVPEEQLEMKVSVS